MTVLKSKNRPLVGQEPRSLCHPRDSGRKHGAGRCFVTAADAEGGSRGPAPRAQRTGSPPPGGSAGQRGLGAAAWRPVARPALSRAQRHFGPLPGRGRPGPQLPRRPPGRRPLVSSVLTAGGTEPTASVSHIKTQNDSSPFSRPRKAREMNYSCVWNPSSQTHSKISWVFLLKRGCDTCGL